MRYLEEQDGAMLLSISAVTTRAWQLREELDKRLARHIINYLSDSLK